MIKDMVINDENIRKLLREDLINRNRYLNVILEHLNQAEENEIIALDGSWGSGKTVFLKELEYLLKNEDTTAYGNIDASILKSDRNEYMTYYFNAWENDDAPNAMLSLVYKLANDSCLQKPRESVGCIPRILNTIIKFGTQGAIDIKTDLFGEQWNNQQITDEIKTSEEIKTAFVDLIDNLLIENKNKILIIIDEIDRCKPIFAVSLLESIKHFYNNDKVVFIIGTNNKELGQTICKVYGENYDGYGYLDRLFDVIYELPYNYIEDYLDRVVPDEDGGYSVYIPKELAKDYKLTMRDYNRYKTALDIVRNYFNSDSGFSNKSYLYFLRYIIVPIALLLKVKNKTRYYKFINGMDYDIIKNFVTNNIYSSEVFDLICKGKEELSNWILSIRNNPDYSEDDKARKIIEKENELYKEYYDRTMLDNIPRDFMESSIIERMKDAIALMQ